jgi:hypothetical protein
VQFIYRAWSRVFHPDPAKVLPYRKDTPEYAFYTADRKPHLDLANDELKKLSSEVVNGEQNPLEKARRIHNWIGRNLLYQYAREYSTLENISAYCASRRAGDCGQHGMLFIAMCRMNGVPARWQSGWESFADSGRNMHDWCEFYVEPYGWLPADPDMAVNILQDTSGELDTTQSEQLASWMFGNMDHFRLAVNNEWGAPLYPAKNDFRSETVDFQRGEVEYENTNLYFDKWDYSMNIKPVTPEEALALAKPFMPAPPELPPPAQTPKPPPPPPEPETTATEAVTSPTVEIKPPEGEAETTASEATTSPTGQAKPQPEPVTAPADAATTPPTPAISPAPTPAPTPAPADDPTSAPARVTSEAETTTTPE